MNRKSSVQKLVERLNAELDLEIGEYSFRRTYAGRHQRSSFAWSWAITEPSRAYDTGSMFTVKELLEVPKLSVHNGAGGREIFPEK